MPQYKDAQNNTVNVPAGKCWKGHPVNRWTDEQRATVGLYPMPTPEPHVPTVAELIQQLDDACRVHIDQSAHWSAGPIIYDKAKANKPKSKAIKEWTEACWAQFYTNRATLEALGGAAWDESMLVYPVSPYSVWEAMNE
jgi:hypothetical protein